MFKYIPNNRLRSKIVSHLNSKGLSNEKRRKGIIEIRKLNGKLDESQAEDLYIQNLISELKDTRLDLLWHLYNVGYFREDTEKFMLENKIGSQTQMAKKLRLKIENILKEGPP